MEFVSFLYEPMKTRFHKRFVQIYEAWKVCDDVVVISFDMGTFQSDHPLGGALFDLVIIRHYVLQL